MVIVVTGAAGKTGQAVLTALAERGAEAWGVVRRDEQRASVRAAGGLGAVVADLRDPGALERAVTGADAVYHIGPNLHPQEREIGESVLAASEQGGVDRVVYHSVLHPQTEAMPHHWRKLRVEERLLEHGLAGTVLQPAAYMQNLSSYWDEIVSTGRLRLPYDPSARVALVDLGDVAEVAAAVLTKPGHEAATYQLCGAPGPSQHEVAAAAAEVLDRPVTAERMDPASWEERTRAGGLDAERVGTLRAMFAYYERHGLPGNTRVLEWLLGRAPTPLSESLARLVTRG
ncbi:SDR family oxidoreductase [Egibacter rhizosphaerae]|nr:NmrA family NAD(P)-binding protein [Egibacter rhizosphaerae]